MQVKTEIEDLQNYLIDASNLPNGNAEKLFLPETREEIVEILKEANEKNIHVTVSGARTGTVGGAIPFGGYVISLEKFNRIIEINAEERFAVAQSGVILSDLQKAVEQKVYFIRPIQPNGVVRSAELRQLTRAAREVSNTARREIISKDFQLFCPTAIFSK